MSARPLEPTGAQWGDPFHGSGPPQHHTPSNIKTVPMTANPHCHSEGAVESQTLPHYVKFFDFNGDIGPTVEHTLPMPAMIESVNDEFPYDPRLFHVDTQFDSSVLATNESDVEFHVPITWNHFTAAGAGADSDEFMKIMSPVSQLTPMPTAPGMSNFEPMMAYAGTGLPSTPTSPSQSSSITRSSSSNGAMTFSRKNSINYTQPLPANAIAEHTHLNVRFESVPTSGPSARRKTIATQLPIEPNPGKRRKSAVDSDKDKRRSATIKPDKTRQTPSGKASLSPGSNAFTDADGHRAGTYILSAPASPVDTGGTPTTAHLTPQAKSVPYGPGFQHEESHSTASQRQRNRVAATKCRAKSKVAIAELEATERAMSSQNMELSSTVMHLREEVLALKNQLLLHGNCDCEHIQQYLTNAARNIGGAPAATAQDATCAHGDGDV